MMPNSLKIHLMSFRSLTLTNLMRWLSHDPVLRVPRTTLRFNASLEGLTELRKAVLHTVTFITAK